MSNAKYTKRQVRSRPGLTQEQALESLQGHPEFKPSTRISSLKRQGSRWTATLLEPKQSEFPPKKDDDEENDKGGGNPFADDVEDELKKGPSDDSDDSDVGDADSDSGDSDSDSPFGGDDKGSDKKDEGDKKDKKGSELGEILDLLHKVVDALGLSEPDDAALLGGPDEGPVPPPGPAPHGPPPGAGGPPPGMGAPPEKKPLKPGMAPPGTTPVGAPAFASVQEMAKHVPTFTATTDEKLSVKEAKEDLETTYAPYKVKQIQRKQGKLHALLSVR